jgi:DNA-binding SARP family transcriptional activator
VAAEVRWDIRLCGRITIVAQGRRLEDGLPGRQGRLLFAYLLANRDRACSRSELVDLLWPEHPPAAVESALSALLSKLRRALGDGAEPALTGRAELRLRLEPPVRVDSEAALASVEQAAEALGAGDWRAAALHAREALAVEGHAFLPDCDTPWVAERRRELDAVRLRALECVAEAGLRLGGHELGAAEQAACAAIAVAPFRESAHRLLMEIQEAAGNHAEGLRVFDELRRRLRDELGTVPGPAVMAVYERLLRAEPAAPAHAPAAGLPAVRWPVPLASAVDRHAFVGRAAALARLRQLWRASAEEGARRLVLLGGDAGIGKTRLAAEFARGASDEGAIVLYGRFEEDALAPYQPVVEMLRGWSGGASLEPLRARLGPRGAELGLLLPELGPPVPEPAAPAALRHETDPARIRLFDAVAALLGVIGEGAPLVVVLDDLQWADRPTLQLVRHLVRGPAPERVLYVGTYREPELSEDHPLRELIRLLRREGALEDAELEGLGTCEVAALVDALCGVRASPGFLQALTGETEGNPFFIEEVVRHLEETVGAPHEAVALADAGVPAGVREVTSRRLRRLGGRARQAVTVAASIGREFDFDVLERVAAVRGDDLVAALEEAIDARVIREVEGQVGRYQFSHALIRATLYDGISALRRARLHGRVGEAIATLRGPDLDAHLPALAHHFAEAAPVEEPARAVRFALAAARRADRQLAWEEAAVQYRRALCARALAGQKDEHGRCELLLALAASEERAGLATARATAEAAAEAARALGDPGLLARAALALAGPWSMLGRAEEDEVRVLEEALDALGDADDGLRARLLARLALELYYVSPPERRLAVSEEAVALARRLGDPATLAVCLDARHYALWRPETVEQRLAVAAELRAIAEATGDPELELEGAACTIIDLLELGDVRGADAQLASARRLAARLHRPLYEWWTTIVRTTRAQLDGRFDEAEALAQEALAVGQHGQTENAEHYFAIALFNIRREQGRLAEVEPAVEAFIERYPAIPAWRCAQALLHVELGRPEAAGEAFAGVAGPGFDALPRDANWLIAVTLLAEVCGARGDAGHACRLYTMLEPYAGRNVVVGRAAGCNGSASRLLGILAATLERWDVAERHFAAALDMHAAMGARPWTARTEVAWAEMLLARAAPGDAERARERLEGAIELADELGMVSVAARARGLAEGARPRPASAVPAEPSRPGAVGAVGGGPV